MSDEHDLTKTPPDRGEDRELSDRHQAFLDEYITNGFNATRAAIAAGYAECSASVRGHLLIRNDKIRERVDAYLSKLGASRDRVLAEMVDIAINTDMADFEPLLRGEMNLAQLNASGVDTRKIKKLKVTRRVSGKGDDAQVVEDVTIELQDAQAERDRLAKVLGLYRESERASAPQFDIDARTVALLAQPATESERAVREMLMLEYAGPLEEEAE